MSAIGEAFQREATRTMKDGNSDSIQRACRKRPARIEDVLLSLAKQTVWAGENPDQHLLYAHMEVWCSEEDISELLSDRKRLMDMVNICHSAALSVGMDCQGCLGVRVSPCVGCNLLMDRPGGEFRQTEYPRARTFDTYRTLQLHRLLLTLSCLVWLLEHASCYHC